MKFDLFTHYQENNPASQAHYQTHVNHFNDQCSRVLLLLKSGEKLTTTSALINYRIGDLRRRIKDLRDKGIDIKDRFVKGTRFKEYYITKT